MLARTVSVVLGCALASSAWGLPFQAFQISVGGQPGVPGQPVFVTGGAIHQDPLGDDNPPASTAIGSQPSLEFDSYVGLDSIGPSTPFYSSSAAMISAQPFITPGALTGQWGNVGGVPSSATGFFGASESVFVARLVVTAEAQIDGPMMVGNVVDEGGPLMVGSELTILNALARPDDRGGGAEYRFIGIRGVALAARAFGGSGLDVYDIYLVREIPAPGTLGLGALGMFAWAPRRR